MTLSLLASYLAMWILVLLQSLLLVAVLRQLGELRSLADRKDLRSNDGSMLGSSAPKFSGHEARSGDALSSNIFSESGGIVLFLSSECATCRQLVETLKPPLIKQLPPIIAVCQGEYRAAARLGIKLDAAVRVLLKDADETAARYKVSSFPTAVIVDREQVVKGYGHPKNVDELSELVAGSLDYIRSLANLQPQYLA